MEGLVENDDMTSLPVKPGEDTEVSEDGIITKEDTPQFKWFCKGRSFKFYNMFASKDSSHPLVIKTDVFIGIASHKSG